MQRITLTFWLIIQLFLVLFLVLESKGLPLLFGSLSSYSQTNFQVQKAKVYLYFLAHYPSILKLISRSRKQRFTFTSWLIIHLFLNSFLGLECKGLPLLFGSLSSYSQTNFQVLKAKVSLYFLAHYPSIFKLISRSRMQGFTVPFWLIIKLFLDSFLGLVCKDLPILSRLSPSYSQMYLQVQKARVYLYVLPYFRAILRPISRSRMQGFTLTFCLIIQLFLDLFIGLECKGSTLVFCSLSSYSQTYSQVQNARVCLYFLAYDPAFLRRISRSRMEGFTLTFWLIIKLFLGTFLRLECKVQSYFSTNLINFLSYFPHPECYGLVSLNSLILFHFLLFPSIRMQGLGLTFWLNIIHFLRYSLCSECKCILLLCLILSCTIISSVLLWCPIIFYCYYQIFLACKRFFPQTQIIYDIGRSCDWRFLITGFHLHRYNNP